jgi:DNA adenine methylase
MATTDLARQKKRLDRLADRRISRSTVMVHEDCKPALDVLRPLLVDAAQANLLHDLVGSAVAATRPVNVSQVKQLSPFRYPGGKTWCIPEVRRWLSGLKRPEVFVEPFAGGAIVSLTAAVEGWADQVVMGEIDHEVAAVWEVVLGKSDANAKWLCDRILNFEVSRDAVVELLREEPRTLRKLAFRTIIKNRVNRGGILAKGASLVKEGENGRGITSRWYPETLASRLQTIRTVRDRITFRRADAFELIKEHQRDPAAAFFIDPPYTAGGKRAGSRLYTHNEIDHGKLFDLMKEVRGAFMMTYDDAPEVREMALARGFKINLIPMKSTHHAVHHELLISKGE